MRRALLCAAVAAAVAVPGLVSAPAAMADSIGWSGAVSLTAAPTVQVDPGDAVALTDGTLLAVWGQASSMGGSQTPVVGTTSVGGTTRTVLDVAAGTAAQPVVAASDDGSVRVAAWKSMSGVTRVVRWSRWNGSSWTAPQDLLFSVHETAELDLQLSRDGQFGVLVAATTGGNLFGYRFDGTAFAGPDTMASSLPSASHPVVAVAGSAQRAVIGWIQVPTGGATTAFLSRRWTGSSWGSPLNMSQEPTGRSTVQGALALSADGTRTMAAWRSQQAGSWTAAAATATGDAWSAPSPLTSTSYVDVRSLGLALADDASTAQVVFTAKTSAAGNNVQVMSNRFAANAWSGSTVRTGPFRPEADPRPSLAMSRDGSRGLLVYQEWDSSGNEKPRGLRYAAGAWESPLGTSLDAINANDRSGVGLAALNGTGTLGGAVWRQVGGGQESARASRLTIRTLPSAPTNVTAQAVREDAAVVSWTASAFDGNWPFPDYAAIAEPNDGVPCSTISTSCIVTGLVPGRTYRFFVYAENIEGATKSELSAAITMPGGETPAPPGTGGTPAPPGGVTTQASAPGAVSTITVKQRKKVDGRKRTVVVRWSTASNASEYRVRITRPGAKRWRAWTTQTSTSKRYRVVVAKRYKVAVLPLAGDVAGTAAVKKFRAKR